MSKRDDDINWDQRALIKRLLILALLFFCCGINNPGSGAPAWVLSLGPILPDIAINWQLNQVWTKSTGAITTPAAAGVTITRASSETNLLYTSTSGFAFTSVGSGVVASGAAFGGRQTWESRTNFLLNSTAPVTQTTGSLANGTYTLWVNGSGTATMSSGTATGCGTSAASQGTPISFTTSGAAGTCTVTVGGSLNFFQLELNPGSVSAPSPGIVTAGATVTRAADVITMPVTVGSSYTLFEQMTPGTPTGFMNNQHMLTVSDTTSANRSIIRRLSGSANPAWAEVAAGVSQFSAAFTGSGAWALSSTGFIAAAFSTTSNAYFNGTDATTSAATAPTGITTLNFGTDQGGANPLDGVALRDAIWLTQAVPSGQLQSMQ